MSDYKETQVTGKKWQRCNVVHIDNPHQAQPTVTFAEQEVAEVDGATFQTQLGQIVFPFDPAATINLRDPGTGELTGQTMTGPIYMQRCTRSTSNRHWSAMPH